MVDNEVKTTENVETVEQTTDNKFEVPESFKEKFKDNPDKAIEQLYKAQHTIVKQKTAEKQEPDVETKGMWRDDLEKFYKEQKFFEENSHLSEHKEQILEFTSKGIDFEDAKALIERKDPTIQNRAIAKQTNFTSWEPDFQISSYTQEQLENMSQKEYEKIKSLQEQGKVTIT